MITASDLFSAISEQENLVFMNMNCVNYKCDEPFEPCSYFLGLGLPWTLMENENAIIVG